MTRGSRFRNFAIGSPMVWIAVFVVVPYLIVVLFSFLTRNPEVIVTWTLTMENYRELFSPVFLKVCMNSLVLALGTTVLHAPARLSFAFILTRIDKISAILLVLMIIPFWTSSLIRTYALIILFKETGCSPFCSQCLISEPLSILYTETAVFTRAWYTLLPS